MIGLYWNGQDTTMDFLSVNDYLPWELFVGPPWLKRETRIS
jgi:hypothetical protein